MLNQELFNALQILKKSENGLLCIIKINSDNEQDIAEFDQLILCAFRLRELGLIDFTEKQVMKSYRRANQRYLGLICQLKYQANEVLKFTDYSIYKKAIEEENMNTSKTIDQSINFYGNIVKSNIAVNSNQVEQSVNQGKVEEIIGNIIDALEQDISLKREEKNELISDANMLKQELKREKPRSKIIVQHISKHCVNYKFGPSTCTLYSNNYMNILSNHHLHTDPANCAGPVRRNVRVNQR